LQGGEVPPLLHVSDDYTKDEVIAIIRNGRAPWKHVLSEEDINRIADYRWSKQQLKKDSW